MKTNHFISLFGLLLLVGCSMIERGVVVAKGHRENAAASPPIDYYWVDVLGKNRAGEEKTERVQLFKPDWDRYKEGDRISPHDYDMIGVTKSLGDSVKKLARIKAEPAPTPTPATLEPAQRESPPARKKSPPTPTPVPVAKPAAPRPPPKPETEATRAAKLRNAEAHAVEDPAVRELKKKIYSAKTDEEQAAAYREYRSGLYQKMRELEPSLKDRIDQTESAAGQR